MYHDGRCEHCGSAAGPPCCGRDRAEREGMEPGPSRRRLRVVRPEPEPDAPVERNVYGFPVEGPPGAA